MIEANFILYTFGQPTPAWLFARWFTQTVGIMLKQNSFATMARPYMKFAKKNSKKSPNTKTLLHQTIYKC